MLILSDGVGAFIGSRSAWQMRDESGRRSEFFMIVAFALICYSLSAFGSAYNSIVNGPSGLDYPPGFIAKAIGFRLLQSMGIWVFALAIMGGERGFVWRTIFGVVDRYRGTPEPHRLKTSGELGPEYWQKEFRNAVRDVMKERDEKLK